MSLFKLFNIFFIILVLILFPFGLINYSGNKFYYLIFTILSTYCVLISINKNSIAFETFFSILLWLGFWFKFTIQISFLKNQFPEGTGLFDYNPSSFDMLINIASISIISFLFSRWFRLKFIFNYGSFNIGNYNYLNCLDFYSKFRKLIFLIYLFSIIFFPVVNYNFSIFQKGTLPEIMLPLGLNNFFNLSLMFGLTSFSSILIFFEFQLKKKNNNNYLKFGLLETLISSISMLSRAMIFNGISIVYGYYRFIDLSNNKINKKFFFKSLTILLIFFIISLLTVNKLRENKDFPVGHKIYKFIPEIQLEDNKIINLFNEYSGQINKILSLSTARWVGIEGLMTVIGNKEIGYNSFIESFSEKFNFSNSFYSNKVMQKKYKSEESSKIYTVYVPGIIAFLFYTKSILFLFFGIFILCIFCSIIEFISFKFSHGNLIFSYVIGNVLAYRLVHFGYMPQNSYKLIIAIFVTIGVIHLILSIINNFWKK